MAGNSKFQSIFKFPAKTLTQIFMDYVLSRRIKSDELSSRKNNNRLIRHRKMSVSAYTWQIIISFINLGLFIILEIFFVLLMIFFKIFRWFFFLTILFSNLMIFIKKTWLILQFLWSNFTNLSIFMKNSLILLFFDQALQIYRFSWQILLILQFFDQTHKHNKHKLLYFYFLTKQAPAPWLLTRAKRASR